MFLTDPLSTFLAKGEIRTRYYNPGNVFGEVHFVSPAAEDVDPGAVQALVGRARLVIHPMGSRHDPMAWLPFGPVGRIMKEVVPDVVRAYDPGVRGSLAAYWGRRARVPSLVSVHADLDEQRTHEKRVSYTVRRPFERYAMTRASAVMCVSHHVARYARRYGAANPVVIYNRVYTEEFGRQQPPDRPESGVPTILSVGRLVPQKYQECLIRAVAGLDARLTLIGDGERRLPLGALVGELGLQQRVTFRPSVPHRDIPKWYHDADIFAIATHYEGFCIPVLEAMAAGLPVVASRIGPIEEIVGDAGMLVENTPAAFAQALQRLLADPSLRRRLGAAGAARARTMDGRVMEEREAALYADVRR